MSSPEPPFSMRIEETATFAIDELALEEFATACGTGIDFVRSLVEEGLLDPGRATPNDLRGWRFAGEDLARARRVLRLQRDFEASLASAALIVDLLDEIDRLRRVIHRAGLSAD